MPGPSGSRNYATTGQPQWVATMLGYDVWEPIARPALLVDLGEMARRRSCASVLA